MVEDLMSAVSPDLSSMLGHKLFSEYHSVVEVSSYLLPLTISWTKAK